MKKLSNRRSFRNFCLFMVVIFTSSMVAPASVLGGDLPVGPNVKIGDPTISVVDKTMNINAGLHDKTWIDWQGGFNIGAQNTVNNIGPSAAAAMLHNDISGSISNIQGILNGNCNVFLLNPNGILFSSTAQINVGGLVASTLMMSQDDFMSGNYIFKTDDLLNPGSIINEGTINTFGRAGVSMLSGAVRNIGTIKANLGTVNLISGREVTLNVAGDGSIQAAMNQEILNNVYDQNGNRVNVGVENLGAITADGGEIRMETGAVQDVFDTLINQDGIVRAGSMVEKDGKIALVSESEGIVQNTGTLDVSAIEAGATGGTIEMTGSKVGQFGKVHADGMGEGNGGDIDIYATDVVALSSESLTTANADVNGDGGEVIIFSPNAGLFTPDARIEVRGGSNSGDGGFVEVSGQQYVEANGFVDRRAPNGEAGLLYIDPVNLTIDDGGNTPVTWTLDSWANGTGLDDTTMDIDTLAGHLAGGHTIIDATAGNGAGAGNITLDAGKALVDGGGNFNLTLTAVAITIAAASPITFSGTGNLTLSGTAATDINAAITLASGVFTSTGTTFDNTGGAIATANGLIDIQNTDAVTIGANLTPGNANVIIDGAGAGADSIVNGGGTIIMNGGDLELHAINGVGTSGTPIATQGLTDVASQTTTGGGIFITNTSSGAVNITTVDGSTGLDANAGNIAVDNTGRQITVTSPIDTDNGTVTLTGTLLDIDNTIDATELIDLNDAGNTQISGTITSSGGSIDIDANALWVAAGEQIIAGGDGTALTIDTAGYITLWAGTGVDDATVENSGTGTISLTAAGADITLDTFSIDIADALTIDASADKIIALGLNTTNIQADGDITITAGAIGDANGGLDITGDASGDSILTVNSPNDGDVDIDMDTDQFSAVNITIADVTTDTFDIDWAADGIDMETDGTALTITSIDTSAFDPAVTITQSAGNILVTVVDTDAGNCNLTASSGTLTVSDGGGGITTTGTADISLTSSGAMVISDPVTAADDVTLDAGGNITTGTLGSVSADVLTITNTGAASTIGTVTATPLSNVPFLIDAATINASTTQGHISIKDTADGVIVGAITTQGDKGDTDATRVILEAVYGDIIVTDTAGTDIDAWTANIITSASPDDATHYGGAIGTTGNPIRTDVTVLNATADDGGVYINQAGAVDIILGDITAKSEGRTPYKNDDGYVVIATTGTTTSDFDIEIAAGANIYLGGLVAAPDDLTVTAVGSLSDSHDGTDFIAGTLDLTAGNAGSIGIGQSANPFEMLAETVNATCTGYGVYLTEGMGTTVGTITSSGTNNDVTVTASTGNLVLGVIDADSDDDATVTVESTQGAITDNNTGDVNIFTKGISGTAVLTAADGIGASGDYIDTTAAILSTTATETDAGTYIENGATDLTSITVDTEDGVVGIEYGALTLSFTAGNNLSLDDSTLTTLDFENTGGDINLAGITVDTTANITASTSIDQASGDITVDTATLTAGTNIGASGTPILTDVTTLTAAASAGDVYITEADGLTLTASAAGTTKDIVAIATLGNMTINAITATGDVTLTAASSLLDGDDAATNNISGTSATLVATAGAIGESDDPIESEVVGAISATSGTGTYLTNVGNVSSFIASTSNDPITFTNTGSVVLNAVDAGTNTVTLTASRNDITDGNGDTLNITAGTLNVDSGSFGASDDKIDTIVGTMDSIVTTNGGIYIDEDDGVTINTVTAGGNGDVDILSAGTILLGAITASGDDVTLKTTGGNITDNNAGSTNVTAETLDISATGGTVGSNNSLELAVSQITTSGTGGINAAVTGKLSLTADSFSNVASAVTISADDITIVDGSTATMGAGGTINLTANYGNIVFVDTTETIATNNGAITLTANYDGDPTGHAGITNVLPGRIKIGNLTTGNNQDITLAANSDITIGHLNAGSGTVAITASNGLILDGNTGTNNITAGTATLVADMHTTEETLLAREKAIAAYAASVAEANSEESLKNTWDSNYTTLTALVADTLTTKNTSQSSYNSALSDYNTGNATLDGYNTQMTTYAAVRTAAQLVKDGAAFVTGAAQAVPFSGDAGADAVFATIDLAFSIADAVMTAYELTTVNPQEDVVSGLNHDLSVTTSNLEAATLDYNNAVDSASAANGSLAIATADYNAAVVARDHANEIREQAIASYDATDAISELEISAGTVDVTTTGAATGAADMTLTGATAVGLDTIGDISITNAASAHATLDLVTSDGDVTYTQTGAYNVLIDVVTADTTDDTVTITSAGAIYDDANDSTVDITAATITLSAGSDGVGQTNGTLDINATTALNVTTSGNGNITIEDLTGDLPVGTITAGSGTVALTSAGTIDDATSDTTTDITAANLALTAATGIGAGEGVETVVSIYAATTTAGDMNVDNAGTLSVGTVAGVTGARITAGGTSDDILIVTASPLTVDDAVLNAGGGNITLVADGTAASDKLTINNTITASGGNGNITLYAGEDINQNAFAVTAAGSGNINYYAGVDYNGGTPQAGLSTGLSDITMNGNSATATSDSGNITMTAPRNIVLGVVSTSGDVSMTADDSTYIASNSNGGITEVTSDAATNITAATATLRAATGIGSGDDLETKITALDALNSISGNINIEEIAAGGALGINRVTQSALGDILVQTADGILTVTAGQSGVSLTTGALTLSAGAGSNDDLVINAAIASTTGKVNLDATNDVIFGAAGDVTTTSGEIEVAATDAMITMVDGTVLDAGDDLIDLDADENIALGSLVTINDTATAIDINTANGAVTDANTTSVNITAASGEATIKAQTGVDVDTTLATIDVINDASGTININETDGLLINRIVQTTDGSIVVATAGATTVVAAGGGITTDASSATGDSISITVAGDSSLTVNDGVTVDNGTISLLADDDVIFGADGDMDAGVGGAGTDGDTITITADNDSDASGTGGAITLADGTLIDAGDGTIDLNADEDIALGGLITTDNTASAIAITSTSGAITDSGDAHTDIIADTGSAVVTIDAVTGVGSANALETTVATIDIDNNPATGASATGNIQIIELDTATGGLIIQKASQGDVGVDTANSGNIDISTVDGLINVTGAILARDGGTITIDANDANTDETLALTVGNTITSSVGLKDVGLGPVYAGNITLSADHDIDVNAKISTANANADYTANGDISLTTDSGQLGDVRIGNEIEVVYEGSIAVTADVDVDFDTVNGSLDTTETTAGADATITARTGNITETYDDSGAATVDIQANTITLNAVSGTIGQVADGTTIEIDSVLAVNADTSTGNGDITLREWAGNLLVDLITAGTGTVTLTAASAIEEEATGDVAADIVGATLDLTAGGAIGGTNALETTTADLTAHATATGDIVITETDGLLLRDLDTSDGDITIVSTTGNITIENAGVLATSGDVTIEATAGTINDAQTNTDTTTDITGNAVTLTAATGIGETADVDTAATTLDVSVTGTGVIVINEADAVELLDIDTADGSITITSAGAMTVTDVIAGGDTGSNDDVTLTTTSGDIIMSGDITALNDEVTLVSAANVTDTTSGATDISAANLTITANSGTVGAGGLNNELDTDVDTLTIAALGDTYVLEDSAITLTSIVTTNGLIDIEAGGTITTTTVTAGGVNGVTLYATAGNIFDTAGGLITAGADSSLKASGIIGTAVTTSYNPVNVDIDGDLWVWAGDQRNGVSVILEGYVNSSAETERVEIYEPSPPGLVMLDNRLMGGGNYGSGSVNGSILSRGYGETLIAKTDMFSLFYDRAVRPCGHKISTSWLPFEGYMIDNDFFKYGYRHPIDISQLDLKPLPAGFFINPEKAQYYIIRAK